MDEQAKADLEKLENLREQALCGPEEEREKAEQAYEALRESLFQHQACEVPDDQQETRELTGLAASVCEDCGRLFAPGEGAGGQAAPRAGDASTPALCDDCRRARRGDAGAR